MERVVVILLIFGGRSCYPAVVNVTSSGFFSFSLTTTPPILVNGVEISKTSLYDNDVYQQYDKNHEMSTDFLINDARCEANQWWCGGVCIHRRKRCFNRGGCHPEYPMPCEKRERCFKANDDCWHRACQTEECQWASQSSTLLSMKQRRFIASCPDENQRLLPCDTDKNPHLTSEGRGRRQQMLCFYKSEQYCKENNKCVHISSKCFKNLYAPFAPKRPNYPRPSLQPPLAPINNNNNYYGIDPRRPIEGSNPYRPPPPPVNPYQPQNPYGYPGPSFPAGPAYPYPPNHHPKPPNNPTYNRNNPLWNNQNCPNKWTPCYGMCMDSDYPYKCGEDSCLSVNDMTFFRECDKKCIRNHIACNGECRRGYTPCRSKNQCFKDPEGRCNKRRDCFDGSDEYGCFRTFVWWIALPTLSFLLILIIAVYFTLGWFIRRTLAVKVVN